MLNSPIQVHVIDFLSSYLAKMDPRIEICTPKCVYTENVMIMFGDVGRELRRSENFVFTIGLHLYGFSAGVKVLTKICQYFITNGNKYHIRHENI